MQKIDHANIDLKKKEKKSHCVYIRYHRSTKGHRGCYGQLYVHKMGSLEEMDEFLETYNLLGLNHEEIEHLNRSVTSRKIKSVIRNHPAQKNPGPDGFTGELY